MEFADTCVHSMDMHVSAPVRNKVHMDLGPKCYTVPYSAMQTFALRT